MSSLLCRLHLLFGLLLGCALASAQAPGAWGGAANSGIKGSISGLIVDSVTGQPVEFATLVLKRVNATRPAPSSAAGVGAMSDSARQAMFVQRLTERLGHAPDSTELAEAKARFAERLAAGGTGMPGTRPGSAPIGAGGNRPGTTTGAPANAAPEPLTQVDGIITDMSGSFNFREVALGDYIVEASFIGYDRRSIQVQLTGRKPDASLGDLRLAPSAELLTQVVVTGEAALVENRVDKIVYNASQDVVNQGGDGSDVLRRVPLLSVDLDGNVSLRGSTQVQILINGRPSTMFAGSVGEALQSMPAEQIEKVEVITSPGARYQGEGTAGIINIITKRGGLKGLTGSIDGSLGTRSNNAGLNLAYTRGRFGVNGGFGSRFSWPRPTENTFLRIDTLATGSLRTLSQNSSGTSNWIGLNGNVGAFYDLNAFNSFTTSLRINGRQRSSDLTQESILSSPSENVYQRYILERENLNPGLNYDWTTDYKRKFAGEDHELNVAFQLGASTRNSDYTLVQESLEGNFGTRDEIGDNQGTNLEYTFQVDYQAPLVDKLFLETGGQTILRRLVSDYDYFNRPNPELAYSLDLDRSNVFDYDQDVYAGYVSLRNEFTDKWSGVAGLRYEYTGIAGVLQRADTIPRFSNNYGNYLPSASIQYKISTFSNLRSSYSRRIRRPGLNDINPFVDRSDPRNISFGNPTLSPEVTDQIELAGNTRITGGFLNASVFYRATNGLISEFSTVDAAGVTRQTSLNLGSTDSYGANAFVNLTIAKVLKLRGGVNVEHLSLIGAGRTAGINRQVWQYDLNGSFTLELPQKIVVEGFGFYRAPQQTIQGERASFRMWSIGAQKKLMDDKWRIGVRIVEPFERRKNFPGLLVGEGFRQETNYSVLFRSFGISGNYRFGQLSANRVRERRSRINNNDQREGGGGEF